MVLKGDKVLGIMRMAPRDIPGSSGQCSVHPGRRDNYVLVLDPGEGEKPFRLCLECERVLVRRVLVDYFRAMEGREPDPLGPVGPMEKEEGKKVA